VCRDGVTSYLFLPLISVILPTYNRAAFLERAIGSIAGQTLLPDELIVVDDGSTDGTDALLSGLAASFPCAMRVLRQENRGAAAARNLGISHAQGDILVFLDSDDWWDRKKIALQYEVMRGLPHVLITHTKEIWFRKGRRVNQKKKHAPPSGYIFPSSLKMCVVGMSTVMARRDFFIRYGLFDEQLPCCEDYDLWLRAAWDTEFLLVDHALTLKEGGRPDQLSRIHAVGMDKFRIRSLVNLLADTQVRLSTEQRSLVVAELKRKCAIYGQGCIKHGRGEEGAFFLRLPEQISANNSTGYSDADRLW
jgi:glycosyltransferase involved in cell wall biosynthesis